MPSEDISRSAFYASKRYRGVRMQQGRVLTDDDWNSEDDLGADDIRWTRVHVIGPAGSPDDGFRLGDPEIVGSSIDFELAAGTYYVSGHRVTLLAPIRFASQPDWLDRPPDEPPAPTADRTDFVYLEVWEQIATAVEDEELFEKALGGPDTTTRRRLMARVRVLAGVEADDCDQAWDELAEALAAAELGTLDATGELVTDLQLVVTYADSGDPDDLCTPSVAGGYLGAENQAIRVQLFDGELAWAYDDAAPPYRATIDAAGQVLTLLSQPRDAVHWPLAGQTIEILRPSAELANGEVLAAVSGHLTTLAASFDPITSEVTLAVPHPDGAALAALDHVYVRMWRRGTDLASPATTPVTAGTPIVLGNTGITVTVNGTDLSADAYWVIAVRPETPDQVVPWELEVGRSPNGIRRFYAPIGMLFWEGDGPTVQVEDCRPTFPPLTAQRGCCRYTVGDGTSSHGQFDSIQDAIDALPVGGGEICLLPGTFTENVEIRGRTAITIHGCHRRTTVLPLDLTAPTFSIVSSTEIRLEKFAVVHREQAAIAISSDGTTKDGPALAIVLHDLDVTARDRAAILAIGVIGFDLTDCRIAVEPLEVDIGNGDIGAWPAVFAAVRDARILRNRIETAFGEGPVIGAAPTVGLVPPGAEPSRTALGGLQIAGQSARVDVIGNFIGGGLGNGITLGSVVWPVITIQIPVRDVLNGLNVAGVAPTDDRYTPVASLFAGDASFGVIVVPPYVVTDCCPELDPNPPGPTGPNGEPLVPVSAGDLEDIRILDNEIADCGANGVGPAWWWFEEEGFDLIHTRGLTLTGNRIHDCLWLEQTPVSADAGSLFGWGGIAISSASELEIRDNHLVGNGAANADPGCGVFLLLVEHLTFTRNHLRDNGRPILPTDALKAGFRGGLVALIVETGITENQGTERLLDDNRPAARIDGNEISSPDGSTLRMTVAGPLVVHGNQLSTVGWDAVTAAGLAKVNGVAEPNLPDSAYFAGLAVHLENFGFLTDISTRVTLHYSSDLEVAFMLSNGRTLFDDNQVTLDQRAVEASEATSSVYVLTRDDLGFDGNQLAVAMADSTGDHITYNLWAKAVTIRVTDNRFEERLNNADVSARTEGSLNNTTNNQGTHCFEVVGLTVARVAEPNRSWIDVFSPGACSDVIGRAEEASKALDAEFAAGGPRLRGRRPTGRPSRVGVVTPNEPQHTLDLLE